MISGVSFLWVRDAGARLRLCRSSGCFVFVSMEVGRDRRMLVTMRLCSTRQINLCIRIVTDKIVRDESGIGEGCAYQREEDWMLA